MTWDARTRSIAAAIAAAFVVADVVAAALPTAALALLAIVAATLVLAVDAWRARARGASKGTAALVGVLVVFAALKAWAFATHLGEAHSTAGVTYDVVWLAAAALTTAALWAEPRVALVVRAVWSRPRRVLSGSFALAILVTAVLLTLPVSLKDPHAVSVLDALFTATSVVCVTGLAVHDLAKTYTPFGQGVILLAMQVGGIGIMTLAAFAVTTLRAAISRESRYARMLDADNIADLRRMVRAVVVGTIVFEALGTLALWGLWAGRGDLGGRNALWLALFHAVSAFCNAGISTLPGSLARFTTDAPTQLVVMALAVIGGLGFPVWRGLFAHTGRRAWRLIARDAPRPVHFDLATRVALVMSAALLVVGFVAFLLFEWGGAFASASWATRILNALFSSVMMRTAGFTTFGFEAMGPPTLLVAMILMFIGGSSGSTAGGVKTTTIAILFAAVRAELRGHEPRLLGRAIDAVLVRRAVAVVSISAVVMAVALLALAITEDASLHKLAVEVVAAFSTTGVSTGITPSLSAAGKLIVMATMFAGRVGPLTLALALGAEQKAPLHRLPHESLPVG